MKFFAPVSYNGCLPHVAPYYMAKSIGNSGNVSSPMHSTEVAELYVFSAILREYLFLNTFEIDCLKPELSQVMLSSR